MSSLIQRKRSSSNNLMVSGTSIPEENRTDLVDSERRYFESKEQNRKESKEASYQQAIKKLSSEKPSPSRLPLHRNEQLEELRAKLKPVLDSETVGILLVAPLTLATPTNLMAQLYLVQIFHRTIWSRLAHYLMMPCITWTYLIFMAYFDVPYLTAMTTTANMPAGMRAIDLFAIRGNALLALFFFTWWMYWGIKEKTWGLGLFPIPNLFLLWVTSNIWHDWTRIDEGRTWYRPSAWWTNPLFMGLIFALIQTLSHALEDFFPPRVNGTDHWMTWEEYRKRHWHNKIFWAWSLFRPIVAGTVSEFIAGPRLLPLMNLLIAYSILGYKKDQKQLLDTVVNESIAHDDPALDYFGYGGSLPLIPSEAPPTYSEAKRQLATYLAVVDRNRHRPDKDVNEWALWLMKVLSEAKEGRTSMSVGESVVGVVDRVVASSAHRGGERSKKSNR